MRVHSHKEHQHTLSHQIRTTFPVAIDQSDLCITSLIISHWFMSQNLMTGHPRAARSGRHIHQVFRVFASFDDQACLFIITTSKRGRTSSLQKTHSQLLQQQTWVFVPLHQNIPTPDYCSRFTSIPPFIPVTWKGYSKSPSHPVHWTALKPKAQT
jgi:hypothetical protein